MIILDEQLLGRGLEAAIGRWYSGAVRFITDLRPGTVIKDDAIPLLLSRESEPTFLTINEADFWLKVPITRRFCVVCVALPDSRSAEIPALLQRLFHHPAFRTKAQRMGCVVRLTATNATCYSVDNPVVRPVDDL